MEVFAARLRQHAEHIKNVGAHCATEETTKQALMLPLLDILGFSPYDPTKVKAEYYSDFTGVKAGERVDYALFCNNTPVMFIEAKSYAEQLKNHCPQLSRYFNATPGVTISAITNGREWRFFTDLVNKNIMDAEPFLTVKFDELTENDITQLYRFRHDEFKPDALRALAEESIYLSAFKSVITQIFRDPDQETVKFIANRANLSRQLNAKFLDSITPIVKQAMAQAVSDTVMNSLSDLTPVAAKAQPVEAPTEEPNPDADEVNPENSKIITTKHERKVLALCQEILGDGIELSGKDTESYYTVLYQGKTNRWILRYYGDKKRPTVQFITPLTDQHKKEIQRAGLEVGPGDTVYLDKPENLLRLTGLIYDALSYCQLDDNFSRQK